MFIELLKYAFLLIFLATAFLGIASIPGWIKIPESYRKTIFTVLILEVIGVMMILGKQVLLENATAAAQIEITPENWVALNDTGALVQPELKVVTNDSTITHTLGNKQFPKLGLTGELVNEGLSIKPANHSSLGTINMNTLKQLGLFNSLGNSGEISGDSHFRYVKWIKSNNAWKPKQQFLGPFRFIVSDTDDDTVYKIVHNDKILFTSSDIGDNLFDLAQRRNHLFEHNGDYYFFRIASADLSNSEDAHVHVINIKLETKIEVL